MPIPPQVPDRSGFLEGLSASRITTALAVSGAVWFGLITSFAVFVYHPVGVAPREIGLSSPTLLAQATAGLITVLVVYGALIAATGLIFSAPFKGDPRRRRRLLRSTAIGLALISLTLIFALSLEARWALRHGKAPARFVSLGGSFSLFGFSPWQAEVARLHPNTPGSLMPTCALYLGQADSTIVLLTKPKDGGPKTWRVPASSLTLELHPDKKKCPIG